MFVSILDAMVDADQGDFNIWYRFYIDWLKESMEITAKVTTG